MPWHYTWSKTWQGWRNWKYELSEDEDEKAGPQECGLKQSQSLGIGLVNQNTSKGDQGSSCRGGLEQGHAQSSQEIEVSLEEGHAQSSQGHADLGGLSPGLEACLADLLYNSACSRIFTITPEMRIKAKEIELQRGLEQSHGCKWGNWGTHTIILRGPGSTSCADLPGHVLESDRKAFEDKCKRLEDQAGSPRPKICLTNNNLQ